MDESAIQSQDTEKTKRSFDLLALSGGIVFFLLTALNFAIYLSWDFDDSYIVYRIVHNILNGRGWVYNVGEYHNASTSALNTIIIALAAFPSGQIQIAAHLITSIAILGTAVLTYRLFTQQFNHAFALLTGILILILMSGNYTWGLETNLLIFFILLFVFYEARQKNSWPVLGLAVLTRPDAVILVGLKWLRSLQTTRRFSFSGLLIVFAILTPWVLFSLYHFQQIFPATLESKIWQGASGYWGTGPVFLKGMTAHYFANSSLLMRLALPGAVVGLMFMVRDRSLLLYFMIFVMLQNAAYTLLNVPSYTWYFAPTDAAIVLAAMYAVGKLGQRMLSGTLFWENVMTIGSKYQGVLSFTVLLSLLLFGLFLTWQNYQVAAVDARIYSYVPMTQKINEAFEFEELAALEVGFIGYHTGRNIVDLTGLTSASDQYITLDRMDAFYQQPPRLLLLHDPVWSHETAIFNDYRFPFVYEKSFAQPNPYDPSYALQLYTRRPDYAEAEVNARLSEMYPSFDLDPRFTDESLLPLPDGEVFLDHVDGYLAKENRVIVHQRSLLQAQGWAVDKETSQTPANVLIILRHANGAFYSLAAQRVERPDVAAYLKSDDFRMAGFVAMGHTSQLPSGTYDIFIAQEIDGRFYFEKPENEIVFAPQ